MAKQSEKDDTAELSEFRNMNEKENVITFNSAIYLHFSNNLFNAKLCMDVDFLYICMNKFSYLKCMV